MSTKTCCYVSFFFDINRDNWTNVFKRSFDEYLNAFLPFFKLFEIEDPQGNIDERDEMIVFLDSEYYDRVIWIQQNLNYKTNIRFIRFSKDELYSMPKFLQIQKEREIMFDPNFRNLLGSRTDVPEHNYPEYTLLNHSKIDFVCKVITDHLSDKEILCWVDFGFFTKNENIPNHLLDLSRFNLNKITLTLINPRESQDDDMYYTLLFAPEVVGGFWFIGNSRILLEYQKEYFKMFDRFQNEFRIVDDDQHLNVKLTFACPNLFDFERSYTWHKVLVSNQKKGLKVISFCLWGNTKRYTVGLIENIKLARIYYPEWIIWVYIHEKSVEPNFISSLRFYYPHVKIILKLEENIRPKRFMLWRLEPLWSEQKIEYFISRDIDTRFQPREIFAVREWIASGKSLHIMRDHPQHYPLILGGMFGIKCSKIVGMCENWNQQIEEFYLQNGEQIDDQLFLTEYLYKRIPKEDRIIHDEIKRYENDECLFFPIKYEQDFRFVGCYVYEDEKGEEASELVLKNWLQTYAPYRISTSPISLQNKLEYIRDTIDEIHVMHYTKLVDRKAMLTKQLNETLLSNFCDIKWCENFDREQLTPKMIQEKCILNPYVLNRYMTIGEIANGLAYISLFEQIASKDPKETDIVLFLEDDIIFKENFVSHLYHVLKNLPKDWESICLGGLCSDQEEPVKTLPNQTKLNFKSESITFFSPITPIPETMSCMLMNRKAITKITKSEYFKPLCGPVDHSIWVINIDQNIRLYWVNPWIAYEGSKTDIFTTSLERGY